MCADDYRAVTSSLRIGTEEQVPSTVDTVPSSPPLSSPTGLFLAFGAETVFVIIICLLIFLIAGLGYDRQ